MVTASTFTSHFLDMNGSLWGVGFANIPHNNGPVGHGGPSVSSPVMIRSSGVISVENGNAHNMFIDENGSLWTFGRGDFQGLGNGGGSTQFPVKVIDGNVTQASGGSHRTCLKRWLTLGSR